MSAAEWINCMPEDDAESFSERSDERRRVFEDAAARLPTSEISPLVWAFLQVADLEQVKLIVHSKVSWRTVKAVAVPTTFEYEANDAVLLWKQRPSGKMDTAQTSSKRSFSSAFSEHSPPSASRPQWATHNPSTITRSQKPFGVPEYSLQCARSITERCKERDHGLCAVSRVRAVDSFHIVPRCAFGGKVSNQVVNFWETLREFWPQDRVDTWYAKLFQDIKTEEPKGTERVENMLTFTSTLHRFHLDGAFALRPVRMSADKTQLELEFHWLARQARDPNQRVDLMEQPLSTRNRTDSGEGYKFCRYDHAIPTLLVSGTRFTMTTDDAINKPLPDPGLLELQWHLQRVLAMSGASEWKEADFDYIVNGIYLDVVPSVEQWVHDQSVEDCQRRSSSPFESVKSVDTSR